MPIAAIYDSSILGYDALDVSYDGTLTGTPLFHVYIRDQNLNRLGELTDWTSFSFEQRFNSVGTWALETSSDSIEANLLTKRGGIIVTREIAGHEETIFSGPVATEWGYTARTFRAAGYSDEYWLLEPARPTPSLASPPWPDAYDVRTNTASTLMRDLIVVNIGDSAPVERRLVHIVFPPDPFLGSVITSRANLEPLLTIQAELAITPYAGGLGFVLRQSDTTPQALEYTVYAPPDKSADVKFSIGLNTISDYEDMVEAPAANRIWLMGGDGFGANRTVIEEEDSASIAEWGQLPAIVIDERGTSDLGELNQRAAEEIAKVSTLKRTAVTPFDVPALQFGKDYDLGTLVTVVTHSGEVVDLIRAVRVELDAERGSVITPVVGQGDGSDDERMATITRTIQDRLSNLERNWNVPPSSIDDSMLHPFMKWAVGDLRPTVRSSAQPGWLLCQGQTVSQTTYSALYGVLGTTWNTGGEPGGTFRLPNGQGRVMIGTGAGHTIGQYGGAESVSVSGLAHTHPGSHSHGMNHHVHGGAPHSHPGSHSHGMAPHRHQMGHDHTWPNNDVTTNSPSATSNRADGSNPVGSAGHWHTIPAHLEDTSNSNNTVTGDGEKTSGGTVFTSTDPDSNAPGASYSGNTDVPGPSNTENDANAPSASYSATGSVATMMPYFVGNWEIFAAA